ncbi:MAG: YbaN family protein [Bdellovibrionales bacterium]
MWLVLGWIFVAIGAIGLLLPIMPTVPFLLVAAYCFERGSPRLHDWLLQHRWLGPPLRDWRQHRVIRWQSKILAVVCISSSISYAVIFRDFPLWIKVTLVSVAASVILFILIQKSRRE